MKYTEMELSVIKAFKNSMNYYTLEDNLDDNCTCLDVNELSQITGYSVKQVKGIVGSLTKKNLIVVESFNFGETALMVTNEGIKAYFELFENNKTNKEENTMIRKMTREEKLWSMTGVTLLGVAEKLGIKTTKSTLKQGKEKLIAKILEVEHMIEENQEKEAAEKEAKNLWEKEADEEKATRDQKQAENDKAAEDAINKSKTEAKSARRGILIEYNGRSQNICKWAEELGISANTLYGRIYHLGWEVEKAFTTPGKQTK